MTNPRVAYERLLRQRIAGEGLERPAEVVRRLGAVQAQDYTAAKWALGLRMASSTDAEVESAFTAGEILRTHIMRPTWHFVHPEDIRWMQALTTSRVHAALGSQFRGLELDAPLLKSCNRVLAKALRDGKQLTRPELGAALAAAGIHANGLRLAAIIIHAELEAIVCSGGRRGKQFTYALVEERAPQARHLKRDEALALLTERYFTSHGPATLKDYAWWSGLAGAGVRRGVEMVKERLICEEIDGQTYWLTASAPEPRFSRSMIYLLPNYDEYIVGYTDRGAIFDEAHARHLDSRHNPLFQHIVISGGEIAGTWKRAEHSSTLSVEVKLFAGPRPAPINGLRRAAKRLATFSGLKDFDLSF